MRKLMIVISAMSVLANAPASNAGMLKWAKRGLVACALVIL